MQIAFHRAGWYSYDSIYNFGRGSAERILPKLQRLAVGDVIPMGPRQSTTLWAKDFELNQWMLWWSKKGSATWL